MASRTSEAYAAFAYAYDQALGIRFAQAVRKLLQQANASYPPREKTHLDVACGTGLTLELYEEEGWRTVGVDASTPMLQRARPRGRRLVAGDYRDRPLACGFVRI